jgi:hypothetical protein
MQVVGIQTGMEAMRTAPRGMDRPAGGYAKALFGQAILNETPTDDGLSLQTNCQKGSRLSYQA